MNASQTTAPDDIGFGTLSDLIRGHAVSQSDHAALVQDERTLSYGELDALMDRVAAALQRDGIQARESIAICAGTSIEYAAVYLGALRAGVVVAPLAPSCTAEELAGMAADAGAKLLFLDAASENRAAAQYVVAQPVTDQRQQFPLQAAPDAHLALAQIHIRQLDLDQLPHPHPYPKGRR